MGSMSSISSSSLYQVASQNPFVQSMQNLQAIGTALQSGDLSTA